MDEKFNPSREWFLKEVAVHGEEAVEATEHIFEWASSQHLKDAWAAPHYEWGRSYTPVIPEVEGETAPFSVAPKYGHVFMGGKEIRQRHPFTLKNRWDEVVARLYEIPEVVETEGGYYPHIGLNALSDSETWTAFFTVVDDVVGALRRSAERGIR